MAVPAPTPIVYRVAPFPTTEQESADFQAELYEVIPYPLGMPHGDSDVGWPPFGFTGVGDAAVTTSSTVGLASQLPEPFNLEWVQGDSPTFQFIFTDVMWTPVDPGITDPDAPTWVETNWAAEVRNPYIYSTYAADYWVPAYGYQYNWWRGHSIVACFTVTSEVIEMPDVVPTQWATKVTMFLPAVNSAMILPGNWFRWDLQTRTVDDIVTTHLRGKARIITEWTVA